MLLVALVCYSSSSPKPRFAPDSEIDRLTSIQELRGLVVFRLPMRLSEGFKPHKETNISRPGMAFRASTFSKYFGIDAEESCQGSERGACAVGAHQDLDTNHDSKPLYAQHTHTHTNPTINGRPSKDARDHQETSWTRQKCFPHKQTGTDTDWEHVQARRMQRMDTEWSLGANQDCRHFGPGGKSQEHKESGWLGFAQTA